MITKEITLCGKQVVLAYCYATEIGYKINSDEEVTDFIGEVITSVQSQRMPDIRKSLFLITAALTAYYESKKENAPITTDEIMYESTPDELGLALGTIISLRADFYHLPKNEPEDKPTENDNQEKNE